MRGLLNTRRRHGPGRWPCVLVAWGLWSAAGAAESIQADRARQTDRSSDICAAEDRITFRGFTVRLENDLFVGTDQSYTNGVALLGISRDIAETVRPECLPSTVRWHASLIKWLDPGFWANADHPPGVQNVVVKFGQSMYTPADPQRVDLIDNDRPYAGLLYVGMSWNRRSVDEPTSTDTLDTREITLGVIGPWSLARQAQNLVHDAIGANRFLGWDHQIRTEPALQMAMDRKFKQLRSLAVITPGLTADAIRSFGLRVGNIETSAALSVEGRVGWNIPNDFGTYPIRPGAENRPPSSSAPTARLADAGPPDRGLKAGIHLFSTLEVKAVAHDFSLDGNLFRSSHRVSRRPWVAQASLGLSTQLPIAGRGVKLAWMRVWRTREFEQQTSRHSYGSVAASIEF